MFFKWLIGNLDEITGWFLRMLYMIIFDKITRIKASRVPKVSYTGNK